MFLFLYKCKDFKSKNVAVNSLGRVERKDSGSLKRWYFMGGTVSQEAKPTLIGITKNLSSYPGSNSNSNILWFGQNVVVFVQSKV